MKNFSWRIVLLWTLPLLVVGFFLWQGTFTAPTTNTSMSGNAANTRMTYGRFLDYLNSGRVTSVELYENGRTAIVQAIDPELDNRLQKLRVDLPANSPELIAKLREADVDFDYHPPSSDGAVWGLLGNLIFPVVLIGALFLLFRRSNNMPGGPGQAMNFGKSKAKFQMEAKTGIMFDDVAGID
ncbi:MAG: ATP-dependent metallopeptidase FtsH/Yme1/Tma family protein, partial [Cyanobacteria bacterium P01_G01_bin.19]